jgi:hypothetical protein
MLSFAAATAVLTRTRYVVVHGPVSPATVSFIMGEGKAIREPVGKGKADADRSMLVASERQFPPNSINQEHQHERRRKTTT